MEYRQNANWCETQHPRDSDGKFTSKGRVHTKLSKSEYAIVRNARAQKFAEYRRGGVPKRDYVFTSNKFVVFINNSRDDFVVRSVLSVENDRELIARVIKELENGKSD